MDRNYGMGGVVGSTLENTPVRETEVSKIMVRLEDLTKYLHESTSKLENRLISVLSSSSKMVEEKPSTPEYSTPHAQRLLDIVTNLENLGKRIDSLKNQVEL